jgi:hypothetical protein
MKRLLAVSVIAGLALTGCGNHGTNNATKPRVVKPAAEQVEARGGPVPPAMSITTITQLRDRSRVVVLGTVTGATAACTQPCEAHAESTPVRVDQTLWGSLPAMSSGQFTLTRFFSDPSPLVEGQQYLMFLQMGGPGTAAAYVIPNQVFSIDGTEYVNDSPYSWFPGRRDRQQTDQEIKA